MLRHRLWVQMNNSFIMDSLVCIRRSYLGLGGADPLAMPLHILRLFLRVFSQNTSRLVGFFQGTALSIPPVEGAVKD